MRHVSSVAASVFLAVLGCRGPSTGQVDEDGDGSFADGLYGEVDCNDADAGVHPGVTEICDGIDNDCSGVIDDILPGVGTMYYPDDDEDGYGRDGASYEACDRPAGYSDEGGDCDDSAAAVHPLAPEIDCADAVDYNCDGSVGFADADGDGFAACKDCDDKEAQRSPLAVELCNGVDDDCDSAVDEDAADRKTWYADADADGFGAAGAPSEACAAPQGTVADATDCDDALNAVHPGALETCNHRDDNCNDVLDEDATDANTWYADLDGDGYAGLNISAVACAAPDGFRSSADDCDDLSARAFPGGVELCDGVDNDCDGGVDVGATDARTWYADGDADGYGVSDGAVTACAQPIDRVARAGDCDDAHASAHPGGVELCDALDNDCNGAVDDGAAHPATWHVDADADGFGDSAAKATGCSAPSGTAAVGGDCDDHANTTYPGAAERCDGVDNNCNSAVDDNAVDTKPFFVDEDGDGVGVPGAMVLACSAPAGFGTGTADCDDADADAYPGAAPSCDTSDLDCDGISDGDQDMDGYLMRSCGGVDCDDENPYVYPGGQGCTSHGSIPFPYWTSSGCSTSSVDVAQSLGEMTWKQCVRAASDRGAMVLPQWHPSYPGWGAHRRGQQALQTVANSSWSFAGIETTLACYTGRDRRATSFTDPVTQRAVYDGFAWAYEDLGSKTYDECQLAASNAGAMLITPAVLGYGTGDGYWIGRRYASCGGSYVYAGGSAVADDGAAGGRRLCMIGYPL